jgi:hypothetical protein
MPFHKLDVGLDSDADGLPDSFEEAVGMSSTRADTDGDGIPDGQDDADGDGRRDLENYWTWDRSNNQEFRCTIPLGKRTPKPVVYYNTGNFPRSQVCDEHDNDPKKDNDPAACAPYEWTNDTKVREEQWSALHHAHQSYSDTFWRIYLRGAYGWSLEQFEKWMTTRDPQQVKNKDDLKKFGDESHGYYAFALCPNNPVDAKDPWPCRFPRHSFSQAKQLMDHGLTFNHLSFDQARRLLEAGKEVDQTPPRIRVGDIRYSNVHYAKDYSAVSPLGYGPSAFDPRTGEILSGFANVYSYVDYYATYMQEIVDLLNGNTSATSYINGEDLTSWLSKMNITNQTKNARRVSPSELRSMHQAMEQKWMKQIPRLGSSAAFESMRDASGNLMSNRQLKRKLLSEMSRSGLYDPATTPIDLSVLKGTPLEKRMVDNEVLMASGYMPSSVSGVPQDLSEEVLDRASLARGGFLELLDRREQWRMEISNRRSILFADMVDEGAASLAYRIADKQKREKWTSERVWSEMRKLILRPVLEHEMGHTVGLMHNFGGSDDALNFFPEYWQVRTEDFTQTTVCNYKSPRATDLCPFFIKPKTAYQLGKTQKNLDQGVRGLEDYAYASIMDYDRWPTLMSNGLARYDHAALMYGYADKVEVFKDTGPVPAGVAGDANVFEEWWDSDASVLMLYSTRAQSFHYTNWFTQMKDKMYKESNRQLVDYRDVNPEMGPYGRPVGWVYTEGNTRMVRVPYVYCSHSSYNISESCMTWDWGADQFERMDMHVNDWDTWYILNAFTRDRYPRTVNRYVSRRYSRFYKRLKNFNNLYALYQGLFHQWYDQDQIDAFFEDPVNGWGAYTVAMHDAFNTMLRTLAMPDIKGFKALAAEPDGQMIHSEAIWTNEEVFQTDLGSGRYFTTSWYDSNFNSSCGYEWWECLHHFGFYLDKIIALYLLSNAQTYFVARDTAEDIRQWRISFFDNFTDQIIDFFGGLLAEDYDTVAPWFDPSKPRDGSHIVWRDYADPSRDPAKPNGGGAVEAATRFTLQLYAAVLGMLRFQRNFDNEFAERTRLWKEGKGTGWEVTQTAEVNGTTTFVDPFTGTTYVGLNYVDGRGIAQRMIAHANRLKSRTDHCATLPGQPDSCASKDPRAETALYEYRQLMDIVVQVTTIYDTFGHNWSWDPFDP